MTVEQHHSLEVFINTLAIGSEKYIVVTMQVGIFVKNMSSFSHIPTGTIKEDQPNLILIGKITYPTDPKTTNVYLDKLSVFEDKRIFIDGSKAVDLNTIEDYKNIQLW